MIHCYRCGEKDARHVDVAIQLDDIRSPSVISMPKPRPGDLCETCIENLRTAVEDFLAGKPCPPVAEVKEES